MRIADALARMRPLRPPAGEGAWSERLEARAEMEYLRVSCETAIHFDVTEAVAYWNSRGSDAAGPDDLPSIMPPFGNMFLEYAPPPSVARFHHVDRLGVLFQTEDAEPGDGCLPETACVSWATPVGFHGADGLRLWAGSSRLELDVNGKLLEARVFPKKSLYGDEEERRVAEVLAIEPVRGAFFALALMHCKNVQRAEVIPPEKLSRKHEKKHGKPLLRYYTLQIQSMRQQLDAAGAATSGLRRALHVCRGHFKSFDEKPLFGRLKGTYWWPAHVRGKAENGVVAKGYAVRAPAGDTAPNETES